MVCAPWLNISVFMGIHAANLIGWFSNDRALLAATKDNGVQFVRTVTATISPQDVRDSASHTGPEPQCGRTVCLPSTSRTGRLGPLGLVVIVCLVAMGSGCAKKMLRHGMPFDLDKIFENRFVARQEDWKERGVRLAKDKDFTQAIESFMRYVEQEPQDFFGFNAIAVCYKNLGDHANAMKNYERALEFAGSPEDRAKVLANIGNLYFSADKPQVALGYYKEAAAEFEKNPLYLIFIARTFVVLNDNDRARKVLTSAEQVHKDLGKYERDEDRGLGSYLMAYCYAALNEEEKVFQHLENALKANPERYVGRIEQDLSDEKSLLYTLKEDKRLRKILNQFRSKVALFSP